MRALNCIVVVLIVLVTGCASTPQEPISLTQNRLESTDKIVVVATELPKPGMTYPGASCLLCLAAAATANSALSSHSKQLPTEDLNSLAHLAAEKLQLHGVQTEVMSESIDFKKLAKHRSKTPNTAKYNFSQYKRSHDATHVAVIEIDGIGMSRSYASYIPSGPPQAYVSGVTYLVDLENHTYVAYQPLSAYRHSEGEWKEKPDFPGLTNAYFQAIENVRDTVSKTYTGTSIDSPVTADESGSTVSNMPKKQK